MMQSVPLSTYLSSRDNMLGEIGRVLTDDRRFVAAWLAGSFGRNEADAMSDLDLTVVVSDQFADALCERRALVGPPMIQERLALFTRFGQPAVIHENNRNAPDGGTFTFVLYTPSAVMVDWILVPHAKALRPPTSLVLFEKASIPLAPEIQPESPAERVRMASETVAFFWMMTAITIKYIVRHDAVFVQRWLEELDRMVREIQRLVAGESQRYRRGSLTKLESTCDGQVRAIRQLCTRMLDYSPRIVELGGVVPDSPMPAIKTLLDLVEDC